MKNWRQFVKFRARTLVVLRHGVLANWLVECFSLVVPNMVLSKLNIQKLVSQHTRGRYTFQPLWVSGETHRCTCPLMLPGAQDVFPKGALAYLCCNTLLVIMNASSYGLLQGAIFVHDHELSSYSLFSLTWSEPCWCTKQWQNVTQILHNNRIKFSKDFFSLLFCSPT